MGAPSETGQANSPGKVGEMGVGNRELRGLSYRDINVRRTGRWPNLREWDKLRCNLCGTTADVERN